MLKSQVSEHGTGGLWRKLRARLSALTLEEKRAVHHEMRSSAAASFDFYVLMLLSSFIAYFGLIQDSEAVIIGAMLVAPLMSPMMAMAFGIVMGSLQMSMRALLSTAIGIGLVVGMSAIVTVILPRETEFLGTQIVARTQPALFDLAIALLSGGAGAYALSRKEVAAALPGVAIAAALVPPLCVLGLGIGLGEQAIASGALLLFATNLVSVLFAGSLVFLLLGFGPVQAELAEQSRRRVLFTIVGVLLVAIPLSITTVQEARQGRFQTAVEDILGNLVETEVGEVENTSVRRNEDGYEVSFSVYAYDDERLPGILEGVSERIQASSQDPVAIQVRIIRSSLSQIGSGQASAVTLP